MKIALSFLAGVAFSAVVARSWARASARAFTAVPPETHPDCKPRYRKWVNGEEVSWTSP